MRVAFLIATAFCIVLIPRSGSENGRAKSVLAAQPEDFTETEGPQTGVRQDVWSDSLPPGALCRFGTIRLRHHDDIVSLAVSPDGKTAATAGGNRHRHQSQHPIRLWDLETGKQIHEFVGHGAPPCALAFSSDGKTLASVASDTVSLWDIAAGKRLYAFLVSRTPEKSLSSRLSVAFSPDARLLASSCSDHVARMWDVRSGSEVRTWRENHAANSLRFSRDGKRFASLGGGTIGVFDTESGRRLQSLKSVWGTTLLLSKSGKEIICETKRGFLTWCDIEKGTELLTVPGRLLGYSAHGSRLAVDNDGELQIWDMELKRLVQKCDCETTKSFHPIFWSFCNNLTHDSRRLVLADGNRIKVLDTKTGRELHEFPGHASGVVFVGFTPDGANLVTAGDTTVAWWERTTGKPLRQTSRHERLITGASLSKARNLLATSAWDGTICFWDLPLGNPVSRWDFMLGKPMAGYAAAIRLHPVGVAIAPDGKKFAAAPQFGTGPIQVRDTATGKERLRYAGAENDVQSMFFLGNGHILVHCYASVELFDSVSGKRIRQFQGINLHGDGDCMAISPDDRIVATGGVPPGLQRTGPLPVLNLWEVASGKKIIGFADQQEVTSGLAFSPDGSFIASGSCDGTIRLWHVATGKEIKAFRGHKGGVTSLAFSADGTLLASGSTDCTALIWSLNGLETKKKSPVVPLQPEDLDRIWTALLSEDPSVAYPALWKLVATPELSIAWLERHLTAVTPSEQLIRKLLVDLNSQSFQIRERATQELKGFGKIVEPALLELQANALGLEVRRRAEKILGWLKKLPEDWVPAQELRAVRLVQALEYIGTKEAQAVLRVAAGEDPSSKLAKEARAALDRLSR
ncbi:MAG: hypothetical protein L0Y72_13165 [Gemmataceae bacterium]|nr:hypothetical protein [Gemmataceae bacterium]